MSSNQNIVCTCKNCGSDFLSNRVRSFCCVRCKNQYFYNLGLQTKKHVRLTPQANDREYTRDTIFLVHKYKAEGMSVTEISKIFHRSESNIMEILKQPITKNEKCIIQIYFNPYRKRKYGEVDICEI